MKSDSCHIKNADLYGFLPSLEDKSVDCIITDPPFSARVHKLYAQDRADKRHYHGFTAHLQMQFEALDDERIGWLAREFSRLAKRWVLIFASDDMLPSWQAAIEATDSLIWHRFGVWTPPVYKPNFHGHKPAVAFTPIIMAHARGSKLRWNGGGRGNVWSYLPPQNNTPDRKIHPSQKPLGLIHELVQLFSDPDELVLDPFSGSGTTAVACKMLGRRHLGIELDPEHYANSITRLNSVVPSMFFSNDLTQEKLFTLN